MFPADNINYFADQRSLMAKKVFFRRKERDFTAAETFSLF